MKKAICIIASLLLFSGAAQALKVTMAAHAEGGDRPVITGTTNLPDGIQLIVSISRKESSYLAEDKVKVQGGAFRTVAFSQDGASLNPGKYVIGVVMPVANVQPPNTWPVIGNRGAKLEGSLISTAPVGGNIVEYKTPLVIGSGRASSEQDRKAREQAQRERHEWLLRSCSDACKMDQDVALKQHKAFNWDRCYYGCVANE